VDPAVGAAQRGRRPDRPRLRVRRRDAPAAGRAGVRLR
jgi:hypothetical protein